MKRRKMVGVLLVVLALAGTGLGDLSDGLVAHYPFNGNANDESGTGNNGSPIGGVTWTTGVTGGGIHLDGTGYVSVPDSESLDMPGASGITLSAFIRVEPTSDQFGIVVKESSSSFSSTIAYEFAGRNPPTGATTMLVSNGSTNSNGSFSDAILADSMWHHVGATWVAGGDIRMYLDGVLVFEGNNGVPVSTVNNTSDPVLIGAFRWNVWGQYRCLTGDMDEVRIYDRVLSAEEIAALAGVTIDAMVNIDPDTLNLDGQGKWVTCYIDLPDEYEVSDIDVESVLLEGLLEVQQSDIQDGVLMVKFDREDLAAYLDVVLGVVPPAEVELVVSGDLADGTLFEGRDMIRVIDEGGGN